jgi:sulfatase modifying factor 1
MFYRTYDEVLNDDGTLNYAARSADGGPLGEADPATVSTFRLDRYLVTVGRFRQFVNAVLPPDGGAGWRPPAGSGKHSHLNGGMGLMDVGADAGVAYETGWVASDDDSIMPTSTNLICDPAYSTWTALAGSQENLPINCINWYESYAFCIWDGGFLPSEAESEYTAAGGSQQREYPWGSTDPGASSQYAIYADSNFHCYYPSGPATCTGVANIAPVGTAGLGAGLWGHLDLAGNLWEWSLDWQRPYIDPCVDCAWLTAPSLGPGPQSPSRTATGGYFSNVSSLLVPSVLGAQDPSSPDSSLGFRCARAP